jgi:hypothetical protein
MKFDRNRLYSILFIACLAGYIWLYYCITKNISESRSVDVCLIKQATNIPCPSCGSTRSIISLTKGNFIKAFYLNPIGYIIAIIMLIAPVWIVSDVIFRNNSLFKCYQIIEINLKKPRYAIPLIFLMSINWIWNITKGV